MAHTIWLFEFGETFMYKCKTVGLEGATRGGNIFATPAEPLSRLFILSLPASDDEVKTHKSA